MKAALISTAVAAVVVSVSLVPAPARACGNSMREERIMLGNPEDQLLADAKRNLAQRRYDAALLAGQRLAGLERPVHQKWGHRIAGLAALELGKHEEAVIHLETAVPLFDNSPALVSRLAEAEVQLARFDDAIARLAPLAKEGARLDADGLVILARAKLGKGDREGALVAVKQGLTRSPRHRAALALREQIEGARPKKETTPPSTRKSNVGA